MNNYVLGFAFNKDNTQVLLIEKNKPEWQKRRLNGVGGKIEGNESVIHAMVREFKEETGIDTYDTAWTYVAVMYGSEWIVDVYYSNIDIYEAEDITDEKLSICDFNNLPHNILPNLNYLIPLCLNSQNLNLPVEFFFNGLNK